MKKIQFDTAVSIRSIPSLAEIKAYDKRNLWWTEDEISWSAKVAKRNTYQFCQGNSFSKNLDDAWFDARRLAIAAEDDMELLKVLVDCKTNLVS